MTLPNTSRGPPKTTAIARLRRAMAQGTCLIYFMQVDTSEEGSMIKPEQDQSMATVPSVVAGSLTTSVAGTTSPLEFTGETPGIDRVRPGMCGTREDDVHEVNDAAAVHPSTKAPCGEGHARAAGDEGGTLSSSYSSSDNGKHSRIHPTDVAGMSVPPRNRQVDGEPSDEPSACPEAGRDEALPQTESQQPTPPKAPTNGKRHKNHTKDVPKGRVWFDRWGLHAKDIWNIAELVHARRLASEPRPVAKLMDLITPDVLRLAFCLSHEESSSSDDKATREEMWSDPEPWLSVLMHDIQNKTYHPSPIRRQLIPKGDGTFRPLGLPALRDKVLQTALLLVLDPLLDPIFLDNSVGFRLLRKPQSAIHRVRKALESFHSAWVLDLDLKSYFDTIPWAPLMEMLENHVADPELLCLIQKILMAPIKTEHGRLEYPTKGTPQGGVLSPLLANLDLHHTLDMWLTTTLRKQTRGKLEFARFADDIVIIGDCAEDELLVYKNVTERMEVHGLTINKDKTQLVNMTRPDREPWLLGQTFPFLGFQFLWQEDHDRGWRLANVISDGSIKKSMMRTKRWLDQHMPEEVTESLPRDIVVPLQHRMAGFYGYYLHPHPDDVWALQKHNSQALQLILDTWGPAGLTPDEEADIRYVMDPVNRHKIYCMFRHYAKDGQGQPRRAEAFRPH